MGGIVIKPETLNNPKVVPYMKIRNPNYLTLIKQRLYFTRTPPSNSPYCDLVATFIQSNEEESKVDPNI